LWFRGYVAISRELSIVAEEEAGVIIGMRITGIYWKVKRADTSSPGISFLEVYSS